MIVYLTYNDLPSGIYNSQVIDVCKFLKKELNTPIRLFALVSLKGFLQNRKKIKQELPEAIVLPMFPRVKNWKYNISLLSFILILTGCKSIIARGVFAANIALFLKKYKIINKVCYDGRGAIKAEWDEYNVGKNINLSDSIEKLEKNAIMKTDFRIAVSNELVNYWRENYQYTMNFHVVIPCTINENISSSNIDNAQIKNIREQLGLIPSEKLLVYSGSSAGWQSFKMMDELLDKIMENDNSIKILFLTNANLSSLSIYKKFSNRIIIKWLMPTQVYPYLCSCDYGILIREKSITNKVSAPTKFAEYLSAGLSVIISDQIGDYSKFVSEKKCGVVVNENYHSMLLQNLSKEKQVNNKALAKTYFTKSSLKYKYKMMLKYL